jgi:hypothetical protein|tara:strand:- start:3437 stop:3808 length:372 start_codon:yes stop_codon:yes gene_type:complete
MKYSKSLNEVLEEYKSAKIFAFMFYAQPGLRDMAILQQGMAIHPTESTILAEEVTEDLAKAYDLNRGWFVRFVFCHDESWEEGMPTDFHSPMEKAMVSYLSEGLDELSVEHKFLFVEEGESNV